MISDFDRADSCAIQTSRRLTGLEFTSDSEVGVQAGGLDPTGGFWIVRDEYMWNEFVQPP